MTPLVRHIVLLVASITLFLIVLGILLWARHAATARHAERSNELLAASQTYLAHAQRSLVTLRSDLHQRSLSSGPPEAIPYRFDVLGALDDIDQNLMHVIRLARDFDYRNAFDLPSRVHRQIETARKQLLALDRLTPRNMARALALLDPVQGTLEQLERIYGLDHQRAVEEHRRALASSLHFVIISATLLVIVAVPLIARLVLGLRNTMRRENRIRNDLEEATRSLETMAMYDALTELGNRHLFKSRLEQAAASARRSDRFSALMYIDLDDFKRINDSLGHDAGDEVLKMVGARLNEGVRGADTVARIGGDEFTVIITDMATHENAGSIAAKLLRRINEPMQVAGAEFVLSASIGITIMPTDGVEPAVLMQNADMALYRAKAHGRHGFQFFVESMNREMAAQLSMENALRIAIREQSFTLHHQPQVDLRTGKVTCVEALVRWPRQDGSMPPPDEFIPLADATGLIMEIGSWVLRQACEDLARLRQTGAPDLRMAVNLSARQFREPNLVARIEHALGASDLPPSALEMEITESTLIEDMEATSKTLDALRALGITIAIDDFGIGYSSLNYLKHLPIDALKIDRSFVRNIETDEADRSIVDAILAMAHSLSLRIVAEGIETEWQLDYLATQRCGMGQGFLFSRPVPIEALSIADMDRTWSSALAPKMSRGLHVVE